MLDFLQNLFNPMGPPTAPGSAGGPGEWVMLDETLQVRWNKPEPPQHTQGPVAGDVDRSVAPRLPTPAVTFEAEPGGAVHTPGKTTFEGEPENLPASERVAVDTTNFRINPVSFQKSMETKIAASKLNGYIPKDGEQYGITTGSPREWGRLFSMMIQQESGHRVAQTNPDGSLKRFATTIPTEKSFGPGQFNIGEYGLKTWADVNNPDRVGDALIRVATQHIIDRGVGAIRGANNAGLGAYFGSIRRPHETLQHASWWKRNVEPGLK